MKKVLTILVALIPLMALGQSTNVDKMITVVGFADLEIEPDIIVIGMSAKESEKSNKKSPTVTMENEITQFLGTIGIEPDKFTLDRYSTNTQYGLFTTKYNTTKSYKITIHNINLLDTVVVKCMESGMNNIYIQKIDHSKIDSLQNILLVNAIESAKNKAKTIADNMNITLGKVNSVNESFKIVGNRSDYYSNNDFRLEEVYVVAYGTGSLSRGRAGSTISLQKLNLSKTIIAQFEIH